MKRTLALLLVLLMAATMLVACHTPDPETPDGPKDPSDVENPDTPSDEPSEDPPSAQKQRDTYEVVTAAWYEDGPYLIKTVYPTEQTVIANVIVTPEAYGVDPTGVKDSTAGIQAARDDCYVLGGGTVFLPVGQYLVTETVGIPFGVVLHGDWQDPDLVDTPEYGTVILAKTPTLEGVEIYDPTAKPLFELRSE
jgi:hypothetical protein